MSKCVILGNGPSAKEYTKNSHLRRYKNPDYACNERGMEFNAEYLYAVDPWAEFDILTDGYAGKCRFLNFKPIPMDIPVTIEVLNQGGGVPLNYDIKIHNPNQKRKAKGWVYYCTGDMQSEVWKGYIANRPDYWSFNRAYILYVPEWSRVENIPQRIGGEWTAPAGAYALQGAIDDGHTEIDVYGFDSIAGVYTSSSRSWEYNDDHNVKHSEHGKYFYDRIIENNPQVNIEWKGIDAEK